MKIISAEFTKGIVGDDEILSSELPQIAFIGRSNVGKSSLINTLLNRKSLVKTSSTPGKTRQINYFLINEKYYFADLPGYGFAKMSKVDQEKLKELILWYLMDTEIPNRKTVLIIDANVGVSASDMEILEALRKTKQEIIIVANKIDKIRPSQVNNKLKEVLHFTGDALIIPFSSKNGLGKMELLKRILA